MACVLPCKMNDNNGKSKLDHHFLMAVMAAVQLDRMAVVHGLCRLSLFLLLVELLDGLNLLFELHSSILKPDLDLSLGEAKLVGHFDPSSPREVVIRVKLLFQLQRLVTGVSLPASPPEAVGPRKEMRST